MTNLSKAISRPLGVASKLLSRPIDEESYLGKLVILTAEGDVLRSQNGTWCYLDALMLLLRVAGKVIVHIPANAPGKFEAQVRAVLEKMSFRPGAVLRSGDLPSSDIGQAIAILNVGWVRRPNLPWINIAATGWTSRVSDAPADLKDDFDRPNPITCLFSASMGVSEVFRRLVDVPAQQTPELSEFEVSLFDVMSEIPADGPLLPENIVLPETLLVGAGAIGNGVALLLAQLRTQGILHVVDNQAYADENLGTCVIMGNEGWVGSDKATRLARWLAENSPLEATGDRTSVADAIRSKDSRVLSAKLVVGGLDNVEARRDLQLLWPDVIIDGGIGALGATVVQHRHDNLGLACLRCSFETQATDLASRQREMTGLDIDVLKDPARLLTSTDIDRAAPEHRDWLAEKLKEGKAICSIVSEAALRNLGVEAEEGFRPSVPFVATAAAALVVAEVVKAQCFDVTYRHTLTVQNLLLGRQAIDAYDKDASSECECVKYRSVIERSRRLRST